MTGQDFKRGRFWLVLRVTSTGLTNLLHVIVQRIKTLIHACPVEVK